MGANLLLDVLLVLIVLLFIPLGFWRGAAREAFVAGGILFGAELARHWAGAWGSDIAAQTNLRAGAARFLVAAAVLLLTTLVLGYGAGAAVRIPEPGLGSRLLGGALAGLNGALFLGVSLSLIETYLLDGRPSDTIDDGAAARWLLNDFGWVLLLGAAVAAACVAAGLIAHAFKGEEAPAAAPVGKRSPQLVGASGRGVRMPRGADAGKFEPARGDGFAHGARGRDSYLDLTSLHIAPSVPGNVEPGFDGSYRGWPDRGRASERGWPSPPNGANGHQPDASVADTWGRGDGANLWRTQPATDDDGANDGGDADEWNAGHGRRRDWNAPAPEPPPDPQRAAARDHCVVCGGLVGPDDTFCPRCGSRI